MMPPQATTGCSSCRTRQSFAVQTPRAAAPRLSKLSAVPLTRGSQTSIPDRLSVTRAVRNREEHIWQQLQTANGRRRMGAPKITARLHGLARVRATETRRRPARFSFSACKRAQLATCGWSAPVTIVHLDCCPEGPALFRSSLPGPSAPAFRACKPARFPRTDFLSPQGAPPTPLRIALATRLLLMTLV
jgi:hypothetical protein